MMRRDLFVYLTGPITATATHSVEDNVASALAVYFECLRQGVPAFCPQVTALSPSAHLVIDYDLWLAYDYAVIDRCTHLLCLPRWETSGGATLEIEYARAKGIPVRDSLAAILEGR